MTKRFMVQKLYLKLSSTLCASIHNDATTLKEDGVEHDFNAVSQKRSMTFFMK